MLSLQLTAIVSNPKLTLTFPAILLNIFKFISNLFALLLLLSTSRTHVDRVDTNL